MSTDKTWMQQIVEKELESIDADMEEIRAENRRRAVEKKHGYGNMWKETIDTIMCEDANLNIVNNR